MDGDSVAAVDIEELGIIDDTDKKRIKIFETHQRMLISITHKGNWK